MHSTNGSAEPPTGRNTLPRNRCSAHCTTWSLGTAAAWKRAVRPERTGPGKQAERSHPSLTARSGGQSRRGSGRRQAVQQRSCHWSRVRVRGRTVGKRFRGTVCRSVPRHQSPGRPVRRNRLSGRVQWDRPRSTQTVPRNRQGKSIRASARRRRSRGTVREPMVSLAIAGGDLGADGGHRLLLRSRPFDGHGSGGPAAGWLPATVRDFQAREGRS